MKTWAKLFLAFLIVAHLTEAQTPTFQISNGFYPSSGTGIGLYTGNYFSSLYNNDVWEYFNGAAQPVQYGNVENAIAGSTTAFGSINAFDAMPANFAAGWTYRVVCHYSATTCTGGASGSSGTIASNTLGIYGASGNITSGSNVITGVTGVGTGPGVYASIIAANGTTGTQYLPSNTYVTAYDSGAGTITLSANATSTQTGVLVAFGPTFTTSSTLPAAITFGDVILIHSPGTPVASLFCPGWTFSGTGTCAVDTTDVPAAPVTGLPPPVQTFKITLGAGQSLTMTNYLDSTTSGQRYYYFQGVYNATFQAKLLTGGMTVAPFINRPISGGTYFSNTVALSGSGFQPYTIASSSINETASSFTTCNPNCTVSTGITFTNTGSGTATAAFIGFALNRTPHTTGGSFDDRVIAQLAAGRWQELRFNVLGSSGGLPTLQSLQPDGYRPPSSASQMSGNDPYGNTQISVGIGLDEFVKNAVAMGANKIEWDIPPSASTADLNCLSDYFGGGAGTACGAIRIALGTTKPWTSTLLKIIIAYDNEAWNTAQPGYAILPGAGGVNAIPMTVNVSQTLKASASWNSAIEKCSANTQQSNGSNNSTLITNADPAGYIDTQTSSDYGGPQDITNCAQPALAQSSLVDAWAQSNDSTYTIYQTGASSVPTTNYEAAIGTTYGNCTVSQLSGYAEGEGQALADVYTHAGLQRRFPGHFMDYNRWEFNGLNRAFSSSAGSTPATVIAGWGDFQGSQVGNARPTVALQAIYNTVAALGTGRTITQSNIPTFNFTAANGIPSETNVPLMDAFAFCAGVGTGCNSTSRGMIVFNNDVSASHSFIISGIDMPQGAVTKILFNSTNVTDNNETTANFVSTSTSSQAGFTLDTLPAHSAAVYIWNVQALFWGGN